MDRFLFPLSMFSVFILSYSKLASCRAERYQFNLTLKEANTHIFKMSNFSLKRIFSLIFCVIVNI